jgi:hypothetical protein
MSEEQEKVTGEAGRIIRIDEAEVDNLLSRKVKESVAGGGPQICPGGRGARAVCLNIVAYCSSRHWQAILELQLNSRKAACKLFVAT